VHFDDHELEIREQNGSKRRKLDQITKTKWTKGDSVLTIKDELENMELHCHSDAAFVSINGKEYVEETGAYSMIGDSGASNHFVGSTEGMFDIENIDSPISGVGNQTATKQGKMICEFQMQDGTTIKKRISVKYVPNLQHNLFSITEELSKGAILSSNFNLDIRLDYPNGSTLSFDRRLRTRDGWVPCVRFAPLKEIACLAKDDKSPCDINEYHAKLGHPNMVATRMTAKIRDVALKGDIKPCEDCMIAKARQKNVPKARIERS